MHAAGEIHWLNQGLARAIGQSVGVDHTCLLAISAAPPGRASRDRSPQPGAMPTSRGTSRPPHAFRGRVSVTGCAG